MDLRLEEIELPDIGPDGVRVKIISDSICMSTYKAAVEGGEHKRVPDNVEENPTIVGHEFCGVITEVGENWKNKFHVGEGFSIQPAHFYKGSQMAPGARAVQMSRPNCTILWQNADCSVVGITGSIIRSTFTGSLSDRS